MNVADNIFRPNRNKKVLIFIYQYALSLTFLLYILKTTQGWPIKRIFFLNFTTIKSAKNVLYKIYVNKYPACYKIFSKMADF